LTYSNGDNMWWDEMKLRVHGLCNKKTSKRMSLAPQVIASDKPEIDAWCANPITGELSITEVAEAIFPVAKKLIVDTAGGVFDLVSNKLASFLSTYKATALLAVTGVAGLIPEVGGLIAMILTIPVNFLYDQFIIPAGQFLIGTTVKTAFDLQMSYTAPLLTKYATEQLEKGVNLAENPYKADNPNILAAAEEWLLAFVSPTFVDLIALMMPLVKTAMDDCAGDAKALKALVCNARAAGVAGANMAASPIDKIPPEKLEAAKNKMDEEEVSVTSDDGLVTVTYKANEKPGTVTIADGAAASVGEAALAAEITDTAQLAHSKAKKKALDIMADLKP
jgi:DNA-binding protein YbaB